MRFLVSFLSVPLFLVGFALGFAALPYGAQLALIDRAIAGLAWFVDNRYAVATVLYALVIVLAGFIWRVGYEHGINVVYHEGEAKNKADRERRLK